MYQPHNSQSFYTFHNLLFEFTKGFMHKIDAE